MRISMSRFKDGSKTECGEPTIHNWSVAETIGYIIPNEMQWGAKWEWVGEALVFKTRVFGDLDVTTITGTLDDVSIVHATVMAFIEGKTKEVTRRLFLRMSLPYDNNTIYSFEDTAIIYGMFLNNEDVSECLCLIRQEKRKEHIVTADQLLQVHDLKKNLNLAPDDGVHNILTNFVGI